MMMLDRIAQLIEANGEGCGVLCYSVHASTMARRHTRGAFLARLMDIPEAHRRLLVGRIAEIEPGTPVVTTADWVHQLRAFTARIALELHPSERGVSGFDTVGAWSIGFVLPVAAQTAANRLDHEAMIRRWSVQAHRQGLKCGLFGLVDPYLIDAAIKAGVDSFFQRTALARRRRTARRAAVHAGPGANSAVTADGAQGGARQRDARRARLLIGPVSDQLMRDRQRRRHAEIRPVLQSSAHLIAREPARGFEFVGIYGERVVIHVSI